MVQHSPSLYRKYSLSLIHQPLKYVVLHALLIWFTLQTHKKKKMYDWFLDDLIMFLYPDMMFSILDN